jgi:hypothetical protein
MRLEIASKRSTPIEDSPPVNVHGIGIPECCFWEERFAHSRVPQVGERVVYLRTGHAESGGDVVAAFVDRPEMPPVASAEVHSVGVRATDLVLGLRFAAFASDVVFPVPECPPFVVPAEHFARSLAFARGLVPGDIVDVFFADGESIERHHGLVLAPPELEPDPYNSVVVEFTDDGMIGRLQPWEIIFPEEPGPEEAAMMRMCAALAESVAMVAEDADEQIRVCRSGDALAACAQSAEAPMDLALIVERLRKGYYATVMSLIADVRQIEKVAAVLGTGAAAAREVVETLTPMIRAAAEKEGLTFTDNSESG